MSGVVSRRCFLQAGLGTSLAMSGGFGCRPPVARGAGPILDDEPLEERYARLDRAAARPVLATDGLDDPVRIASMELLRNGREYLVRVRDEDEAEGLIAANGLRMVDAYLVFLNRVAPFFVGKDARGLEELLWELYRYRSNYKYQGLVFWVAQAGAEMAILDLLGKRLGKPVGDLLGGVLRREVPIYRASGNRGNTPEEEVEYLRRIVEESGATALKFRVGGRMNRDVDSLPGRSEALIPMVRDAFGPEMTLYADSNSSYSAPEAIRVGRLMESHGYAFLEEPCRFDHLVETKEVADALTMPVAGGEQEFSHRRFRWMIANRAIDVVQPDIHYYGGFIRSIRVARMAEAVRLPVAPHMSGSGMGYLDVAHLVSCIPNPAAHHEYKGRPDIPVSSATSSLVSEAGVVRVPSGPGFGYAIDPDYVAAARVVGHED